MTMLQASVFILPEVGCGPMLQEMRQAYPTAETSWASISSGDASVLSESDCQGMQVRLPAFSYLSSVQKVSVDDVLLKRLDLSVGDMTKLAKCPGSSELDRGE